METPTQVDKETADWIRDILMFVIKNSFGILSAMTGFIYQVYRLTGRFRRMTKAQCMLSVSMSIAGSCAMVIGLAGIDMNKFLYGFLCWLTPFAIKEIADEISVRVVPTTRKIGRGFDRFLDKQIKNNTD